MIKGKKADEAKCFELLNKASESHRKYVKMVQGGGGCDRHLFGLKQMMNEDEYTLMFEAPLFTRSRTWELSTSNISNNYIDGFGNCELHPHGIGLTYVIRDQKLCINIIQHRNKKDSTSKKLCDALHKSLL